MKSPHFSLRSSARSFAFLPWLMLAPSFASAALTDNNWSGADNGTFNTPGNWSGAAVPTNASRAVINTNGPTVILNSNPTIGGLSIGSGFTLTRATGDTTDRIMNVQAATAADTAFNNAGTLASGGASGSMIINLNGSGSIFINSGTLEATTGTTLTLSKGQSTPTTLTNTGGTIKTTGTGILNISGGANSSWIISGGALTNVSGGTINYLIRNQLQLSADAIFTNAGTVNFDEPTLTSSGVYGLRLNGTSKFLNSGTFNLNRNPLNNPHATPNNATLSSALDTTEINNSGTMNFAAVGDNNAIPVSYAGLDFSAVAQTLTNTGTINLESKSTTHNVALNSTITTGTGLTLTGAGTLKMIVGTGGSVTRTQITGSNGIITQASGHTIRGAGTIGAGQLKTFTNDGTVLADDASYALTLDPRDHTQLSTGVGSFINNGTVRASGAGGLVLNDGLFTNNGTFQIQGTSSLTQNAGAIVTNNSGKTLDIQGAWNSGTGGGGLIKNTGSISYNSAVNSTNTIGLTGTGTFTKAGTGSLSLSGANTLSGGITITGGTLTVGAGAGTTFTAATSNGTYTVTTADTAGLVVGQTITGTGLPGSTFITGITSGTTFTISNNASSSQATTSLTAAAFSSLGSGPVTINGGTLQLGAGNHSVSSVAFTAGTLAGTGTLAGLVTTAGTSSVIAPGNSAGTLTLSTGLNAAAGASFAFELGSSSDLLSLGAFTGSTAAGGLLFNFSNSGGLTAGTTYTLLNFNSVSGFDYTDLATGSIASGFVLDETFGTDGWLINGNNLQVKFALASVPEPSTYASLLGVITLGFIGLRRRRCA